MTWVKICGVTNAEDALVAVEAGADAVGLVFYEKSPRSISVETAQEIVSKLPAEIEKIGVFVDADADPIGVLRKAGLTGTQSYISDQAPAGSWGRNQAIGVSRLPPRARFLMALPFSLFGDDVSRIEHMAESFARSRKQGPEGFPVPDGLWDTFLLDSGNMRQPGGTGKAFDWNKAIPFAGSLRRNGLKLVVAGGLTAENVSAAMGILKPWGVDVASGVEERPGKKDREKVRAFVRAVREADQRVS